GCRCRYMASKEPPGHQPLSAVLGASMHVISETNGAARWALTRASSRWPGSRAELDAGVHERSRPTAGNGHDSPFRKVTSDPCSGRARGRTECRFLTASQIGYARGPTAGLVTLRNERTNSPQAGLDRQEPSPQASLCHRE